MMKEIIRDNFSILFGSDGYLKLVNFVQENNFKKILILTDENTKVHCLDLFFSNIKKTDKKIAEMISSNSYYFSVEPGENAKNLKTSNHIWEFLTDNGFKRNDLIINLGGGMVSDLGGFVASTYMRGIQFVNIPTTLLGMVDASIGGKTGIDLNGIKNIIGTFQFAKLVLIDVEFLNSLSRKQMAAGYAEMIKHSLIDKNHEWEKISKINSLEDISPEMIYKSINIKVNIIESDPMESNIRKHLNFGHTLGHAIETYLLGSEREILHGEAIAIGLVLETYISYLKINFDLKITKEIKNYINQHYEIIEFSEESIRKIIDLLKYDKKNNNDEPMFVLLNNVGEMKINQPVEIELIKEAFKFYQN